MGIFLRKNNPEALSHFVRVIEKGGVVLHPTDTVYGLGACGFHRPALRRLILLKGRKPENPFLVLSHPEKLMDLVGYIPPSLRKIWGQYLRYPITALLPARVPHPFISKEGKIAIRIPNDEFLLRALSLLPCPIASTSANPSGRIFPGTRALSYFQGKVDLVILGVEKEPLPSTIIDFTTERPEVIRTGAFIPEVLRLKP